MPASPGSTRAPAELSASRASLLSAGGSSAIPSWLHIHSSIAPAAKTPPSSAYSTLPSILQATVGSSPPAGSGTPSPTCASTKTPVPEVAFTRPGSTQAAPARAACWSTVWPRKGARRASSRASGCRARRRCRASRAARPSGSRTSRRAARRRLRACRSAGAGSARRWPVRWRSRAEPVAEEGVDGAHPQPCPPPGPSCTSSLCPQQPGQLGGGEVWIEGQAAELLDFVLLSRRARRGSPASACPARRRSG